ncbi:MAG TPA: hypothetical protein VK473_05415 [Terriglobales bacterium]|nr:hypothetical protein [Terriglobales bacterium]
MNVNNDFRALGVSDTRQAEHAPEANHPFQNSPTNLQTKVNQAIEVAAKAFDQVISAVLGQPQPSHQTGVQTAKDAPKSEGLEPTVNPHHSGNAHGGWNLLQNKRPA